MSRLYLLAVAAFPLMVSASELTPLQNEEAMSGAGCVMLNAQGKVIIADNVKIDGALLPVTMKVLGDKNIKWTGSNLEIEFAISKGKLLLDKQGGFSSGKGPVGELRITQNGGTSKIKARQQCFGDE